jgi:hypothetical protein
MERELWNLIMRAVHDVRRSRRDTAYHTHPTALVVRVYLWAVVHHRPTYWACDPRNWDPARRPLNQYNRPRSLPSQSTMSRRLRDPTVEAFMHALGRRLVGHATPEWNLLKLIDGKPLTVARHSADPDAAFGRGAGGIEKGYKLHAIHNGTAMPAAWEVQPLNVDEKDAARRMIPTLGGTGYLVGDANFDDSDLFDLAHEHEHRFIAPRRRPRTGLGHHRQSPHRVACIDLLEAWPSRLAKRTFGAHLLRCRKWIEGRFGHLVARLTCLPMWVRRLHRVRSYVHAHLLIAAARWRVIRA